MVLALLLFVLGGFTLVVAIRVGRPRHHGVGGSDGFDQAQLRGFCYVGAVGATVVGVVVLVLALLTANRPLAEGVALLGFFGYLAYQLAALLIITWPAGRWPRK